MSERTLPAPEPLSWTGATTTALLLGFVHAAVDCASGFLVFRDVGTAGLLRRDVVDLVILYNVLAFAGQPLVGLVADRLRAYRAVAVAGVLLGAAALALAPTALLAGVVLVGVGNALFHVGAGAHVLRTSARRATEAGVFVGPGAVGLCAGLMLGGSQAPARWLIVAALCAGAPLLSRLIRPSPSLAEAAPPPAAPPRVLSLVLLCAALLLCSVTVRALVGDSVTATWRGVSAEVMALLALAACLGKMIGGALGDRLGWGTLSVAALALSAPLVSALVTWPALAVAGMFLFQMTMAVTLKATHHLMPGRPGLAFGVPCVALVAGALPGLLGLRVLGSWPAVLSTVALSALLVALALHLLARAGGAVGPGRELAAGLANLLTPLKNTR